MKSDRTEIDFFELRARLVKDVERLPREIGNAEYELDRLQEGPTFTPQMFKEELAKIEMMRRAHIKAKRDLEGMDKRLRAECEKVFHAACGARTRALMAARSLAEDLLRPHLLPEVLDYTVGQSTYVAREFERHWGFPGPFSQDKNLPAWVDFVPELRTEAQRCDERTTAFEAMRSGKRKVSADLGQSLHPAARTASEMFDPTRKAPSDLESERRAEEKRKKDGPVRRLMERIVMRDGEGGLIDAAKRDPEIRKRLR